MTTVEAVTCECRHDVFSHDAAGCTFRYPSGEQCSCEAFRQDLQKRARHSPYDYIRWRDHGVIQEARATADTMKAAMLATGTRGSFTLFSARSGVRMHMTWSVAVCFWANLKNGWLL